MRKFVLGLLLVLAFILSGLTVATVVFAQPQAPDGVEIYYPVDGWFCVRDVELGVHFCEFIDPCCEQEYDCPTPEYGSEQTPVPSPTLEPAIEPTHEPTIEPTHEPTIEPTPEPTEKPKCNRGLGNGSEGCDPGNSGGKLGSAGEDNE